MTYILDTNICINFLKGSYPLLRKKLQSVSPARIKVPSIVKSELLYGAEKSTNSSRTKSAVDQFLMPFESLPFDDACSYYYAATRASLESSGKVIGPNDLIIAAIVLANSGTLVTHNVKEFRRVPKMKITDWTE